MGGNGAIDLAHEPVFKAGSLRIDPAHRTISAGGGDEAVLEPKVMQVLIALARQPDHILSRDDLIEQCWDGVIVGDDAINRVISQIRKRLKEVGAGDVSVETVTKVGYQLIVSESDPEEKRTRSFAILAAILAVFVFGAATSWLMWGRGGDDTPVALTAVTILPVNTADPDDDALATGLRSMLSANLNSTGRVRVSALESAADLHQYGLDPISIGERLDQNFVIQLDVSVDRGQVEVRMNKHDVGKRQLVSRQVLRRPYGSLDLLHSDLAQAVVETIPVPQGRRTVRSVARIALAGEDEAIFLMAIGLMRKGSYEGLSSAEELLRQLAERHPENGSVKAMLSAAISSKLGIDPDRPPGKFYDEEAIQLAREARRLAPDLADAQIAEPLAIGPTVAMLPLVERAAELDPNHAPILQLLAGSREAALDFEGLWEAAFRSYKLEPLDGGSAEIGSTAAALGMDTLANQLDEEYFEKHPDPNERLRARSRILERAGDLSEAVRLRFEALSKEPGKARTWNLTRLSLMRNAVGLKDPSAVTQLRGAIHTILGGQMPSAQRLDDVGFWDVEFFMTWRMSRTATKLLADEGRHEELVEVYDRYFEDADDFRAKLVESHTGGLRKLVSMAPYLALSLRAVGREEEAERMLNIAIAEVRSSQRRGRIPELFHVEAARIYAVAGDEAQAVDHLDKAIAARWFLSFPQELFPGRRDASSDSALATLAGHPVIARFDTQLNGWRDRERPQVKAIFDEWDERIANDVYF